jgi:hypothetical protein
MLNDYAPTALKWIFIGVAICCLIAVLPLPIWYYTFLRIITTIAALLAIYTLYKQKKSILLYVFFIITIFFNPFVPIYLQIKGLWIPLDILCGCAFLYLAFLNNPIEAIEQTDLDTTSSTTNRSRVRDIIVTNKKTDI